MSGSQAHVKEYVQSFMFDRGFLVTFFNTMSEKLDTHSAFCRVFLFGATSKCRKKNAKALRRVLSQGFETSVALKKKIAEFAGLPLGIELVRIRRAHDNLFNLRNQFVDNAAPEAPTREHGENPSTAEFAPELENLVLSIGHDSKSPQASINRRGARRRCIKTS